MVSSHESQTATSELLYDISQSYLTQSQFGALTSSTDLVITQYCFMLAFFESNPLPFPAFMDLLVKRLASNPLQNPDLSNAPTRVIDSALLDELAIIFNCIFSQFDTISTRLLRRFSKVTNWRKNPLLSSSPLHYFSLDTNEMEFHCKR